MMKGNHKTEYGNQCGNLGLFAQHRPCRSAFSGKAVQLLLLSLVSFAILIAAPSSVHATAGYITTVAGGGIGDGGSATAATMTPYSVAVDASGNVYILDGTNKVVREINASTGVITTVAGGGASSTNGVAATSFQLSVPYAIALDTSGNIYISDQGTQRVYEVYASDHTIHYVAGNGTGGFSGDGAAATSAKLNNPDGLAVDSAGNIYIADSYNHRIREVTKSNGYISTIAGTGTASSTGDGAAATLATLNFPYAVALDTSGNIYIAERSGARIREITVSNGNISTVAGNGTSGYSGDGAAATSAELYYPDGLYVDTSGNIFIADSQNSRIREVSASTHNISTVAGNGSGAYAGDGGAATAASINIPYGVSVDTSGNIYIADKNNNVVRKVTASTGYISTLAGTGSVYYGGDGDLATNAMFYNDYGVWVDGSGDIYIADSSNDRIREVNASTGDISTVAGTGSVGSSGDTGPATSAKVNTPYGVAVDGSGNIFIADSNNYRIREVNASTGNISTVAGTGTSGYSGDGGPATSAKIGQVKGIAVDSAGNVYFPDSTYCVVRELNVSTGNISTVAGNGTCGFAGDGAAATSAELYYPYAVAVDGAGNIYIADRSNQRIRKVTASTGYISTVAGNGTNGYSGDGAAATSADLFNPSGVAVDTAGNIYISDTSNSRIRMVTASTGIISTIGGGVLSAFGGDGGPATSAYINSPENIYVDAAGNIYFADTANNRVRKIFGKTSQTIGTITFAPASLTVGGSTATVSATATSGLTVSFSSLTPTICTSSGTNGATITPVAAGTCTIAANQAGNTTYLAAAQVTNNITVSPANQTIGTITFTPSTLQIGGTTTGSATATSGLAVTFTSSTPSVCTTSGTNGATVTGVAAGTCTIAANQAGNASYNAAPQVTQNITVTTDSQTIGIIAFTPGTLTVAGTTTASATATSGLAVTFTSLTTGVCTVSGTNGATVTALTTGTCTIAADQAGNATYSAATEVTNNITVTAAAQTIGAITFTPSTLAYLGTTTASATATSGLSVTFTSLTTGVCTVSGGIVTGVSVGTCTIAANQAGNGSYAAATQVTQNISVGVGNQTIGAITLSPGTLAVNGTTTASATATSGLAVTFSSLTPSVCTTSGTNGATVTGVASGTCTIAADQAGNANYNAATEVTKDVTVTLATQTIGTITFSPNPAGVGSTSTASATATSGLAVTFGSSTPSVCTVSGNIVTVVGLGTCTITGNQAGNASYSAAAQVTNTLSVIKGNQTIGAVTFTPATLPVGATTVASATATSGLAVSFTSQTPSICTVSAGNVTGVAVGTCTIAADQGGNTSYNAAPEVTQTITVSMGNQTIGTITITPTSILTAANVTASASATSGLTPVVFTSLTPAVCTVSGTNGSTITGVSAGTCTIAADQAGNSNWNAATELIQNFTVGQGNQTIGAITFSPSTLTTAGTTTASATASSGLTVTFTSQTPAICTASGPNGKTITALAYGTCTIAADQAGNASYNAAPEVTQSITVSKGAQTISAIIFSPTTFAVGGTSTASATATSGLAVVFGTTTPSICSVSGSVVTAIAPGTCTVTADQAGNANYNAATEVTGNIGVAKADQTIGAVTFSPVTLTVGGTTTASATATSGLAVIFSSQTTTICTAAGGNGSTIAAIASGTCTILISQPGNSSYNAATQVTQNITVTAGAQSINAITFSPTTLTAGGATTASATATSGLIVAFTSTTPSVCTTGGSNGATVTGVAIGTCTIAANQAGNVNYLAAPQATQNILVTIGNQTIGAVTFNPSTLSTGGTTVASATATSGLAVTFTSNTPSVCTATGTNGSTITSLTAGICTIYANQAGNASFNPATQVTQNINISMANQTITFGSLSPVNYGAAPFALTATATSGLSVTYTSTNPGTASIGTGANSNIVTINAAGTTIITAYQAGDSNWNVATPVSQTLTVNPGTQTITFNAIPAHAYGDAPFNPGATASSGLSVTYTSSNTSVATVNGSNITIVGVGTSTITANQAGNAYYASAPGVGQTLTVSQGTQTITFGALPPKTFGAADFSPGATINSGQAITYTSSDPTVATIVGGNIHIIGTGTASITASQAGSANWAAAANVSQTLTVGQASQTITFGGPSAQTYGNAPFTLSATASSGDPVSFSVADPTVATVSGNIVTIVGAGTTSVTASQAGDTNYAAAPNVTRTLTVAKEPQTITFGALAPVLASDPPFALIASASSGETVTFSSSNTGVATVAGNTVTIVGAGTTIISAYQYGDNNWAIASNVNQTLSVGLASQTITFPALPAHNYGDADFAPGASSSSGLAVSYTSSNTSVATILFGNIHILSAGTTTITATQAGNSSYNPATPVAQSYTIGQASQTITFPAIPSKAFGAANFSPGASVSSGLTISYASSNTAVAMISGQNIQITGAGSTTITASQSGNANYAAATPATQNFTVTQGAQTIGAVSFSPSSLSSGATATASATATSGLAVTFSSQTPAICTVSGSTGNTVTGVSVGTCTIAADQSGNANYSAATEVTQNITVAKGNQTISAITFSPATLTNGGTTTASAMVNSGLAITFTSATPGVCTISGNTVTAVASGTCTIDANQAGNANYNAATQVAQNITVTAASQTIGAITFTPATLATGGTTAAAATATSGLAVTFTSQTPSLCTVTGSTVTGVAAGTCTIAANQAGNSNYSAAPTVIQNITVAPGNQTIGVITFTPSSVNVGGTSTASATVTSGLAVAFTSQTPSVCTTSGTNGATVTAIASGTCTIAANQAGNANYNAAPQVTQNMSVSKMNQTIGAFSFSPTTLTAIGTTTASATASSGLAVTFTTLTPSVCTVAGSTVSGVSPGTCTIAADQSGNGTYNAATEVTQNINVGVASQTIGSITFSPATLSTGQTTTVAATATSGLAVAYTSTTPSVCTISGTSVTGVASGTCTIAANQPGNTNYSAAPQVTQNITVSKANQTIGALTFTPGTLTVGGTTGASATASSGLAVTFTSQTPAICTMTGSTVTGVAAGTCTVAADQAGNANYNSAMEVTQSITITKGSQTIGTVTFTPGALAVGGTTSASATASSGLSVTFTSQTTGVCTVAGTTVTGLTAGTCTIAADQAGNGNYNAATEITQNITVGAGAQTIGVISFTPSTLSSGGTTTASAAASSGLAVTFSSQTPAVCTVAGSTVTAIAAGTCTIAADQAGNGNYNAAPTVTQNITVTKSSQTIGTISFTPATLTNGGTTTASATATSGLAVTFTSQTTSVCTVAGSTVTAVAAGTCTIAANQPGNANYNAASQVTQSIVIAKANQTIGATTFTPATLTVGGTTTASATASSGLAVTFTSQTTGVCTVAGTTVTGLTAGTCAIAADQAGNGNYNAAPETTQNITVGAGTQTIGAITFTPATLANGGATVASATASSGLAVTFSSQTPAVCTVAGSTVTGVASGTCTIAADQAGNGNYNAAPTVTQNITVTKGSQTIGTLTFTPSTLANGGTTSVSATSTSGLAVAFTSLTPGVCSVSGNTVTGAASGTCTIAADQAGNANYNAAAEVTQNIVIAKGNQTIGTITFMPATLVVGATTSASATASSGLAVTFASQTPGVCTVSGSTVSGVAAGTCTIAADQGGSSNYNAAAEVTQSIPVGMGSQIIGTITFTPGTLSSGGTTTAIASASSGLAVTFSSQTTGVCTVAGNTVTALASGTCTIAADQAGNSNYSAATEVTQNIIISKANQTIGGVTFTPPALTSGGTATVSATATSGLPVTFTSQTPGTCTVSGTTVTAVASGTCTIDANQAGNASYNAASQVTQNITIGKASQSIGAITFNPSNLSATGTTTAAATATSGLPVVFSSLTTTVCSVSGTNGSTITGISTGICIIAADQAGSSNYSAAAEVTQALTITGLGQTITFGPVAAHAYGDPDFALSGSSSSGLTLTYTSSDMTIATVTNGTVHIVAAGTVTLTASQPGNSVYGAASSVSEPLVINKANQTTAFGTLSLYALGDPPFTLAATASSGLPVTFVSSDPSIASVSGNTVTINAAGTVTITASQPGNADFNAAAPVAQSLTINLSQSQTITFGALPAHAYGDADFSPGATASSGLPVVYSSSTPTVATIVNGNIHIVGTGTSVITASQAGNVNFYAAPDVTQTLTVTDTAAVISATTPAANSFVNTAVAGYSLDRTVLNGTGMVMFAWAGGTVDSAGTHTYTMSLSDLAAGSHTVNTGLPLVNGAIYNVTFAAIDGAGIASVPVVNNNVTYDTLASAVTLSVPAPNSYINILNIGYGLSQNVVSGTVTIMRTGGAADPNSPYTVQMSGSELESGPQTITAGLPTLVNGAVYSVSISNVVDQEGNVSQTVTNANITYDTTAVLISATTPTPNSTSNTFAGYTLSGQVSSGKITYTRTGGAADPASPQIYTMTASDMTAGTHHIVTGLPLVNGGVYTVSFDATDEAGNVSTTVSDNNVTMDTVAPADGTVSATTGDGQVSLSWSGYGSNAASYIIVYGTASMPANCLSGSELYSGPSTSFVHANLTNGTSYNYRVCATDIVGNMSPGATTTATPKGSQIISFNPLPNHTYGDAPFSPNALASSGLPVFYTSSNPGVAAINGNSIVIVGPGTTMITASQAGNSAYNPAPPISQFLNVIMASQSITFAPIPVHASTDAPFGLLATASSGLPVSYTSSDPTVATVSGSMVTITGAGSCTITAYQPGNSNYNAAPSASQTLTISISSQSITFGTLASQTYGNPAFTLSGTATSGLAVTYVSSDTGVATIVGNTVTILGAGTTVITASQNGNSLYSPAPTVMQPLQVVQDTQTITFGAIPAHNVGDADFDPGATSSSGLPIQYSSSNSGVATVVNGKLHVMGAGTTTITAAQPGNINYVAAASVQQALTISAGTQTITFTPFPVQTYGNNPFFLTATASSSLPVTFTSSNPSVASVNGLTVTILSAGTSTITASQAGNAAYQAAPSVSLPLLVNKANQIITFGALQPVLLTAAPFNLGATISSGLTISYASSNPAVATVNGNTVTVVGAGQTTITASQPGNGNYNAATSVSQTLTVNQVSQTITFTPLGTQPITLGTITLTATSTSGLPVTYTSSTPAVATVNGNILTLLTLGTSVITASQAGNTNYLPAASVSQTLTVGLANQTITFGAIPAHTFGDSPFTITATASSGLPVTFYSTNPGVVSISGNVATVNGAGTTVISANQAGNGMYNVAPNVSQTLTVNRAIVNVTIASNNPSPTQGTSVTLSSVVTSTLGNPTGTVTFKSGLSMLGTANILGNQAVLATSSLVGGNNMLTAVYNGDNNFAVSTSPTMTQVVYGPPTTPSLNSPFTMSEVNTVSPTLIVNSANDPNGAPVTYSIQVSSNSNFTATVAIASNLTASGSTVSWTVTPQLADHTLYYWRALATGDALNSNWMPTANFFVNAVNVPPTDPAINTPANNTIVASLIPSLMITNSTDMDMYATVTYEFDVATDSAFANMVASESGIMPGNSGTTSWIVTAALTSNTTYYWRARATDSHALSSNWAVGIFTVRTNAPVPVVPAISSPAVFGVARTLLPVLTVQNTYDSDGDNLNYYFDIDTVNTFNSANKQSSGSQPQGNSTTSWQVPVPLTDHTTYYWRCMATNGLSNSPYVVGTFYVSSVDLPPAAPTVSNPSNYGTVTVFTPTLMVNPSVNQDQDIISYDFQLYADSAMQTMLTSTTGVASTSWTVDMSLYDNTVYYWRARATDNYGNSSSWMSLANFVVKYTGVVTPPTMTILTPSAGQLVVSGGTYTITWTAGDPDANPAITLYYNTTGSGTNGTMIASGLHKDDLAHTYFWNLSNIADGIYYVFAEINDGITAPVYVYAPGTVAKVALYGCLDGGTTVDMNDALKALKFANHILTPTALDILHGDVAWKVNGGAPDGKIGIDDVVVILRRAAGLTSW